ncbi:MAG: PGAP1 family protein [Candidatus Woesebacteria bacterium GW2011_GWA1_40_43]|uniref:PGAP1 family protein n=1 Tax=Candidatus Woesebacteria bacterium GW2011_GWA1_40_43 TaxID=1618553 RepID=A0A0G0SIE1_9BACT|nr:MAG: PGAP1 family protein [Candidatus Woesebacteria bacterium GW2011_GWC2_40_30]KKR64603.1 MAG: PGAP1 family protein [Candidatus Woesebacteria bacterium GW2011_GWA1_40_43]
MLTRQFKSFKPNYMRKFLFLIVITFLLFFFSTSVVEADYSCTYRTWNSNGNLYFQMVTYPDLWDYTHIYFDTTSTEPTSASNDNESSWNLGTWADYNNSWQDKWCGIRSETGYDMGCNSSNWPATMPNLIWTYTGVSTITRVYIGTGLDNHSSNPVCSLTTDIPAPTSTPTSTPPTVTKTVFIPGLGASWNANAFANCSFDNSPENWSLASYAEDVYNPILTTLSESDWQVIPFYYDWRQQIPSNSTALSDKIISSTVSDEKVNIVGHSMGGLLASDYLANHDQGIKTNSLLTVGSPLKGAVQAYPAWAGGDIWEDNFISKVATTLYLKHCGLLSSNREAIHQFVPSIQNLLPTFDYLRDSKTGVLKSTPSLLSQNRWLPLNFVDNFRGVKFGTLTGNGQDTLSEILTKGKTKKDLLANWSDGKPDGKIYSNEGDGTILLESSKFDDEHNTTIAQTHSGLINSADGMSEILKFLETPLPDFGSSASADPQSALVVISYPSNLLVTDQDGNTKKDKDGMVAFTNPKQGSYKLKLLPKSNNSLLIVAQFLPNGEVKYKEYNLKGLGPKFKTLKFDPQNPQEDILNP